MTELLLVFGVAYVGLLLWYLYWWYRAPKHDALPLPAISVIVPARNEAAHIVDLLLDLQRQDYPNDLEVIVVDDGSTDDTAMLAAPLADKVIAMDYTATSPSASPKKAALAQGINVALGEWVVTIDADVRLESTHLRTLLQYAATDTVCIAGPVSYGAGTGLLHHFQQLDMLGMQLFSGAGIHWQQPFLCNGANLAFRRQAFLEVHGYEGIDQVASGDDVLLMRKLAMAYGAGSIAYAADKGAVAVTYAHTSWRALWQQRIRWASKVKRIRLAPALWMGTVAFLFHVLLLIMMVMAWLDTTMAMPLITMLAVKWLVEGVAVGCVAATLRQPVAWHWLLPAQLLYMIYVPAAAILGNFTRYSWKGRQLR